VSTLQAAVVQQRDAVAQLVAVPVQSSPSASTPDPTLAWLASLLATLLPIASAAGTLPAQCPATSLPS